MSEQNKNQIGLIGLAVMGQNLALNLVDHRFSVSVYNRTSSKTDRFIQASASPALAGYHKLEDFVASLERPRKIICLVKAGSPTDSVIEKLSGLLDKGDLIVDGGNAHFLDTIAREKALKAKELLFIGSGVSGGEEGARFGPSLMPSGTLEAWELLRAFWEAIAAKVDVRTGKAIRGARAHHPIEHGTPCVAYIGTDGSGHYVKMVHNGIEYSDMQAICEAYALLKHLLGMDAPTIAQVFAQWNKGLLNSFLMEISAEVLAQKDPETQKNFVDIVLDVAGQKGTGRWTSISALDLGAPAPTITEAVFARCLSTLKEERTEASQVLPTPLFEKNIDQKQFIKQAEQALYCSKICAYAQGFQLMKYAGKTFKWNLNFGEIAQIWRGGCIIQAAFLQRITDAFQTQQQLPNLLLDPWFKEKILTFENAWRQTVITGLRHAIALPTFSSALAYFDAYRTARLPQNLLQAQRDFFGAHTYERTDKARGEFYHLDWPNPQRPQHKKP